MCRTAHVFILLVLPASAWSDEAAAVKFVEKLGGQVERYKDAGGEPVLVVRLDRTEITDKGLKQLAGLKNVKVLNLYDTKVTDAGLKGLAALKDLEALDLRATPVTDKGLKELTPLKQLRQLLLDKGISDDAVTALQKALPDCKVIR